MDLDEDFLAVLFILAIFLFGLVVGCVISETVEIQEIKQVDKGYYITINDEIYYKEV